MGEQFAVVWQKALFHFGAEDVAGDASYVFVPVGAGTHFRSFSNEFQKNRQIIIWLLLCRCE
jgi:hypothetical protein